jgi:hypothetical protein
MVTMPAGRATPRARPLSRCMRAVDQRQRDGPQAHHLVRVERRHSDRPSDMARHDGRRHFVLGPLLVALHPQALNATRPPSVVETAYRVRADERGARRAGALVSISLPGSGQDSRARPSDHTVRGPTRSSRAMGLGVSVFIQISLETQIRGILEVFETTIRARPPRAWRRLIRQVPGWDLGIVNPPPSSRRRCHLGQ